MSDLPVYMSLDQLFEEWLDVPEHRSRFTDEGLVCARDMIQETFGYLSVPEELFGLYIEDVFEKFREYDSLYTALEDPWLIEQDDPYLYECDIDEAFQTIGAEFYITPTGRAVVFKECYDTSISFDPNDPDYGDDDFLNYYTRPLRIDTQGLEGRYAVCRRCGSRTRSSRQLTGFTFGAGEDHDYHICGRCRLEEQSRRESGDCQPLPDGDIL